MKSAMFIQKKQRLDIRQANNYEEQYTYLVFKPAEFAISIAAAGR